MVRNSKFRSDNNTRYTQQLFFELWRDLPVDKRTFQPMFSLHDDIEGLVNFRQEYVRDMDPTGYKTATRLLENYDHWQLLMKSKWFKEAKAEWDKELAAKMEKEALDALRGIIIADDESGVKISDRISAAKVLLGKSKTIKGDMEKGELKRGRPSKEEVQGALKEEVRLSKEEEEDASRIRLVKN
jgi:hypothetical protein